MNFEGGYYILPDLSIGAFINYHTNNEYISRQTLPISNSAALTTDQQHSVFQLPFGFATHYRFSDGACQPYIGLKLGANYTKMSSDFYIYEVKDNTLGFLCITRSRCEYLPLDKQYRLPSGSILQLLY